MNKRNTEKKIDLAIEKGPGNPGPRLKSELLVEDFAVELGEAEVLRGEGHFVVIPSNNLDVLGASRIFDDHREGGIEDGTEGVAKDIAGNDFVFGVSENALEFAFSGFLHGSVDFFNGDFLLESDGDVAERAIGDRNADGETIESAIEFRDDFADCFGSARGGRDDVSGSSAATAEVVSGEVEDALVIGVSVDRSHNATLDTEFLVEDFHDRSEAVGGAGSARDDGLVLREFVRVDAEDIGRDVFGGRRSGDDDALGAIVKVDIAIFVAL